MSRRGPKAEVRSGGSLVLPWDEALAAEPDGFIGFIGAEGLSMIPQREAPVVCVNSINDEASAIRVRSDAHAVGRMAAEYFLGLGYERFAYATDVPDHYYSRKRFEGYRFALRAAGKDAKEIQLSANLEDFQRDADAIGGLTDGSALYCVADGCARRVLTLCEEQSIRVPARLAVLGTDNDPFHCEGGRILLSSIDVNHRKVGFTAADTLNDILDGKPAPQEAVEVAPVGVVTRTSSDPAAAICHPVVLRALQAIDKHFRDPEFTAERLAEQSSPQVTPIKLRRSPTP
jgi:LacI family transcriptional regulator